MIQKQADDGDHNSMDKYSGKVAPAHVLTHPHSHWHACMIPLHSITHFLSHTQRLPPGYRDLIQFFSRYPGLVKWTGASLLLYFNASSLDALGSDHHVSAVDESDGDRDDTVDRGGQTDEAKRRCTVM